MPLIFEKLSIRGNALRPSFSWGANLSLAIGIGSLAVLSGIFVAYFCYMADYAAIYYLLALALIVVLPVIVMTRDDPVRFAFTALVFGLPVIAFIVPPGRLGVSIFDYSMLFVLLTELWRRATDRQTIHAPFFPTPELMWIQLLAIPIALMAYSPAMSTWIFAENFLVYVFFLAVLRELQSSDAGERLFFFFSIAVIVLAIGVLFEKITHINLSMSSANLNQLSYAGGAYVHRAAGFFQDPQKAAQFFSCSGVLLFAIGLGRSFSRSSIRAVVWIASIAAFCALLFTASRAALLAGAILIPFVIIFGTRGDAIVKLLAILLVSVIFLAGLLLPTEMLIGILPLEVASRLGNVEESLFVRVRLWFDTWDMFADQPLSGIGLGGFKSYLIAKNPALQNYMGMGGASGIGYIPDQPESGYFKILYEGGLLGSLASLLLVISALWRAALVLLAPEARPAWKAEVVGALASMLVFGLTFVTLFTLSDEKNVVIFVLPLALIWARSMTLSSESNKSFAACQ